MTVKDLIKNGEGKRLHMYQDTATPPRWTIGWGHNLTDKPISERAAEVILEDDIEDAKIALNKALPWTANLDEVRRAVFVDLVYNMGVGGLLTFVNTLEYARRGDWRNAAAGLQFSKYGKQVKGRAVRNAEMLRTGRWPDGL